MPCFPQTSGHTILTVDSLDYNWVESLKQQLEECQSQPNKKIWLLAKTPCNGVVGMLNCLRQETGGNRLRSVQQSTSDR